MMARQDRETILAKMRARSRRLREADPEAYRAKRREHYAENRDTIRQQQAASYERNRTVLLAREKAQREANPERAALGMAKRILARQNDMRIRDIPDELAEVKVLQLEIGRWARREIADDKAGRDG